MSQHETFSLSTPVVVPSHHGVEMFPLHNNIRCRSSGAREHVINLLRCLDNNSSHHCLLKLWETKWSLLADRCLVKLHDKWRSHFGPVFSSRWQHPVWQNMASTQFPLKRSKWTFKSYLTTENVFEVKSCWEMNLEHRQRQVRQSRADNTTKRLTTMVNTGGGLHLVSFVLSTRDQILFYSQTYRM